MERMKSKSDDVYCRDEWLSSLMVQSSFLVKRRSNYCLFFL